MTDEPVVRVTVTQGPAIRSTTVSGELVGERFPPHEDWVNVQGARLTDIDFTKHTFNPFHAIGSTFVRCGFRGTNFRTGSFGGLQDGIPQSRYIDCDFDGTRFGRDMQLGNARFERCSFAGVKIRGWRSYHAEFIDCDFAGELRDCWFTGSTALAGFAQRDENEFRNNDFSRAALVQCQFDYGIDPHAQRWPDDPDYLILDRVHDRVRAARAVVSRWPNDLEREAALRRLSDMTARGMLHQDVAVIRRSELLSWMPEVRDELLGLLIGDTGNS